MKTIDKHNPKLASKKQGNRPILPRGVSDFHKLITYRNTKGEAYLFVDKSLFIRDFLDAGDEVALITRPRRFGKTLTLSMLQHFLASEVDGQSTKGLFDGLKISQYPGVMKYQGQYPVIFLSLKEAKGRSFEKIFDRIKEVIYLLFKTHRYLLTEGNLTKEDSVNFTKILNKTATQAMYESSLRFLSQLLWEHTGKKVYILLDEYDTPINDAYLHEGYEDCRAFLAALFGYTFKGNSFLASGLITGILKIAQASLFSGLNNLSVYTMLDDSCYMPYFGFTEAETDDLLDRAKLPQKAHELKEMYNGYEIGDYTLYNPFSIVSFISKLLSLGEARMKEALKPYWMNTGGTDLIGNLIKNNLIELQEGLTLLLDNKPIQAPIDENITFNPQLTYDTSSFWSILLLSGYVKSLESTKDEYGDEVHTLAFPNEEIKLNMRKLLLRVTFGMKDTQKVPQAMKSLAQGNVAPFVSFVKDYLITTMSYFDLHKQEKEKSYQLLMLGMMAFFSKTHHVRSNRESGKGRYDISLAPKNKTRKAIIIELKVAEEGANLKQVAKKAFQQIKKKDYKADMEARGITDYVLLGMAFSGKAVEVVYA